MNSIETKLWGSTITAKEGEWQVRLEIQESGTNTLTADIPKKDMGEFIAGLNELAYGSRNHLPSRFQVGDHVRCNWFGELIIKNAEVLKVHFSEMKVMYDLSVKIAFENEGKPDVTYTRLYNVDSGLLEPWLNIEESVVDYLKSKGEKSDFESRKKMFRKLFPDVAHQWEYKGTEEQNTLLLEKLKI